MEVRLNTDARNPKRKVAGSGANMETIFVMGGGARLRQDGRVARLRPRGDQRADRGNGRLAVGEHASHRHRGGRSANRRREMPHPLVARGRWRGAWLHVRVDGSCGWQVGLCFGVLRTVPCPRLWQLCQNQMPITISLPHLPNMAVQQELHQILLLGIVTIHADLDVPRFGVARHLVHQHLWRLAEELLLDLHCTIVRICHPIRIRWAHLLAPFRILPQAIDVLFHILGKYCRWSRMTVMPCSRRMSWIVTRMHTGRPTTASGLATPWGYGCVDLTSHDCFTISEVPDDRKMLGE